MSYGRLYVNSEMVVLFASGIEISPTFLHLGSGRIVAAIVSVLSLIITIGFEKALGYSKILN